MSGFRGKDKKNSSSKKTGFKRKYGFNGTKDKPGPSSTACKTSILSANSNENEMDVQIFQKLTTIEKYLSEIYETQLDEIRRKCFFLIDINKIKDNKEFSLIWPNFSLDLINSPEQVIDCFGLAMQRILKNKMCATVSEKNFESSEQTLKSPKIYARFVGFKFLFHLQDLKSHNYGKFVTIKGSIVRASDVKPMCLKLAFACVKCDNVQVIPQLNGCYTPPNKCSSLECSCYSVKPLRTSSMTYTIPCKVICLQELNTDQCEGGRVPRNVECELLGDLTDTCLPGDIVILSGIVKVNNKCGKASSGKDASTFELYISVNSVTCLKGRIANIDDVAPGGIQFNNADFHVIQDIKSKDNLFNLIVSSICPGIYGHEVIKAGLTLSLFGGVSKYQSEDNTCVRGDSHILIVGDPGLGKSQMLLACSNVSPRGVYVCGNSSTASGLTATVTKELGGESTLEAGALVLADQGHCCIDEFDKMTQHSALLEAMEQQTISIAKSGIICTLPARTSILAAANPTGGHYNKAKTVSENLKMSGSLLSRFDFVFIVLDEADEDLDLKMTEHVMGLHCNKTIHNTPEVQSTQCTATNSALWTTKTRLLQKLKLKSSKRIDLIPQHLLRKYISYSRKYIMPKLTSEACQELHNFYLEMRKHNQSGNAIPITNRQLESLIRLTEARAKIELRDYCTKEDAEEVIEIMKYSMCDTFSDELGNLDFERSIHGSGISKRSKVKKFITLLTKTAQRTADDCFTLQQMRNLTKEASLQIEIEDVIETLNTQGVLLKKGFRLYQIQTV